MSVMPASDQVTRAPLLACRLTLHLPVTTLSAARQQRGSAGYELEHRRGPIAFTLTRLGVLSVAGEVRRFTGRATIPHGDARGVAIELELDLASVVFSARQELPGWGGRHGVARFRSTACEPAGPDRWTVRGLLELAGVPRLVTLAVALTARRTDPITRTQVAGLVATARLQPSSFGLLSIGLATDAVELEVRACVEHDSAARP